MCKRQITTATVKLSIREKLNYLNGQLVFYLTRIFSLIAYLVTYLLLRLRLLCGADSYPSNVLQPFKAYCTNPA
jgi:hypothetical protein